MEVSSRVVFPLLLLTAVSGLALAAQTGSRHDACWRVDDVRPGMKGHGRTVLKGTRIETFDAEVLGILKNTSPGRDMVLCRLSGLDLEKTGVIAGMSGSPIYLDGKLLGAVAYAWPFGKEPIAGVTPFCQMHDYVEAYERRDVAEDARGRAIGLRAPLRIDGRDYHSVTVGQDASEARPTAADSLWMVPLKTPLAATGMTPHSLALLQERCPGLPLTSAQGGGVSAAVARQEGQAAIVPGAALSVALILGDFDLSGIGTVTHVEGKRVYGWGHPFFGLGTCDFPLMTGYVHTIYPRQSLSFKMGSPLKTVGVINADVSTCIAGWLDRQPDLLPVAMAVRREPGSQAKTFHVKVVRQRAMLASLVYTALTNSVDMEGELPEELTAELKARIEVEGRPALVVEDTFSGSSYSGGRAPQALYSHVAGIVNALTYNNYRAVRIQRLDVATAIKAGRRSADIEAVELDSEAFAPGETLRGTAFVRPYKGPLQRLPIALALPEDLPEGDYTATVCDDLGRARAELRDNPNLESPQSLDQVFEALRVQASVRRTNLVVRVPQRGAGVALNGKTLPNLPGSMVQILGSSRRTGAQTMTGALVCRQATEWVIQGSQAVRFRVTRNKRVRS